MVGYQPPGTPPLVGATASYTCNSGYTLDGDNMRTCQDVNDGTWTNNDPSCNREFNLTFACYHPIHSHAHTFFPPLAWRLYALKSEYLGNQQVTRRYLFCHNNRKLESQKCLDYTSQLVSFSGACMQVLPYRGKHLGTRLYHNHNSPWILFAQCP